MNHFIHRVYSLCACCVLLLVTSSNVLGHGGGGDIALFTRQTQPQVGIGFAVLDDNDEEQEFFDNSVKVFQAVLIPHTPITIPGVGSIPYTYATDEPGFDANEGALPALKTLDVSVDELWYWDGNNAIDFQPASTLGITGGYQIMPDLTDASGGFHAHPHFGLEGASIPDGVYLARATVSVDGLEDSDPYYLVTLKDQVLETGDPAANGVILGEQVRDYLDGTTTTAPQFGGTDFTYYANAISFAQTLPVPEPNTLVLVMIGAACLGVRYRRR